MNHGTRTILRTFKPTLARRHSQETNQLSFLVSVAFRGKSRSKRELKALKTALKFAPDSAIALWRDQTINKFGRTIYKDAGEDFFFVSSSQWGKNEEFGEPVEDLVVGIADGVGGWVDQGVDPGLFAQGLGYFAHQNAVSGTREPAKLVESAFDGVIKSSEIKLGSSTFCVGSFDAKEETLNVANIGDSTFYHIRPSDHEVLYMLPPQTFDFNAPLQLGKYGMSIPDETHASDAGLIKRSLKRGDIILFTTDGFSDNVFPHEVRFVADKLVEHKNESNMSDQEFLNDLTNNYLSLAVKIGQSPTRTTPFQVEAGMHGLNWPGGKADDVTVVAVLVK